MAVALSLRTLWGIKNAGTPEPPKPCIALRCIQATRFYHDNAMLLYFNIDDALVWLLESARQAAGFAPTFFNFPGATQ